jgi:hypothetical protein
MIEERVKSKQEKLDDMQSDQELILRPKWRRKRNVLSKVERQEKLDEAKEAVKQKIASRYLLNNAKELDKMSGKLEKAAS